MFPGILGCKIRILPAVAVPVVLSLASTLASAQAAVFSRDPIPPLLAGRVVNAITGAPIPRTLVQVNGRAMLTDAEGRFRFDQPGQPASTLRLTKPGFSMTPEQTESFGTAAIDGDPASLTLSLWPEALLVGSVTAPDGDPLPRISVMARRSVFDEQGHRFQIAGQTQTDSHGQFRLPVTAGDYVVETQFTQRGFERDQAVMPSSFPPNSPTGSLGTLHVDSGQEQHLDLHPAVRGTHVVTLPLEAGEEGPPPRITAQSSDGLTFSANASRSQEPGTVRLNLPTGSYTLHATRFSRDGMQFGDSTITVPDHDVSGPALHLSSLPNIPIDIVADTSNAQVATPSSGSRNNTLPTYMQFNLALEPLETDPNSPLQFGVRPTQQRDGTAVFAAPPGVYRLSAGLSGGWYVRSASSRGTDLIRDNLVISSASSPSPITLVVSNQTGSLDGTVKLSGVSSACWIYLVASGPSLPPVIMRRSDASGGFHISDLPPGVYRAVAMPYRHSANLQDPAVLDRFATHLGSVTITAGATATLDLEAVAAKELTP